MTTMLTFLRDHVLPVMESGSPRDAESADLCAMCGQPTITLSEAFDYEEIGHAKDCRWVSTVQCVREIVADLEAIQRAAEAAGRHAEE